MLKNSTFTLSLSGATIGLLLSILGILATPLCAFVFNPGGGSYVGGACHSLWVFGWFLIPYLIVWSLPTQLFTSLFIILFWSVLGFLIGKRFDRNQKVFSQKQKNWYILSFSFLCLLLLSSSIGIFFNDTEKTNLLIRTHILEKTVRQKMKKPTYLPSGLTFTSSQIEKDVYYQYFKCEYGQDNLIAIRLEGTLYPDQTRLFSEQKFSFHEIPTPDIRRSLYWTDDSFKYVLFNEEAGSDKCLYSEEELIKIAKSLQ